MTGLSFFVGTVICTVSAEDADITSPNNDIEFRLASGHFSQFSVDTHTGEVKVNGALDAESSRSEYSIVVSAYDKGQPVQSSQQTISVKVRV